MDNKEKTTEQKDLKVVKFMILLYCRGKHKSEKGKLCDECKELWEYVRLRRSKCPFGEKKPFCSNCRVHCYNPEMREKIKAVMRYSGPRMLIYNPRVAWAHVSETLKKKMADKKALKLKLNAEKSETSNERRTEK